MSNLDLKVNVDQSGLQQAVQQINMAAQQMANMSAGNAVNSSTPDSLQQMLSLQQNAVAMGAASGMSQGYLDPQAVFSRNAYMGAVRGMESSSMSSGLGSLYGGTGVTPRPDLQSYQYPYGMIAGTPDYMGSASIGNLADAFTDRGVRRASVSMSTNALAGTPFIGDAMSAMASIPGVGSIFHQMGYGGNFLGSSSSLDMPVHRQIERSGDRFGMGVAGSVLSSGGAALGMTSVAAGLLSLMPAIGPFATTALLGVGGLASAGQSAFKSGRDYMDINQYYRDVMAPYMRSSRLSGGPSVSESVGFGEKFSDLVKDDWFLTRQDYTRATQIAAETGQLQTAGSLEGAIKAVESVGENIKTLYQVGVKAQGIVKTLDQLTTLGVSQDPKQLANLMGRISLSALQSGQTMDQAQANAYQAGNLFLQQGLSSNLGITTQAASQGFAGSILRSGAVSIDSLPHFGGRQGYESAFTNLVSNMNMSPFGQMVRMSIVNDHSQGHEGDLRRLDTGNYGMGDVTRTLKEFSDLNKIGIYRLEEPMAVEEINKKDPNAFSFKLASSYVNEIARALGKDKVGVGEITTYLRSNLNMSDEQVRSFVSQIYNAETGATLANEDVMRKFRMLELEGSRASYDLTTARGRQQVYEGLFEPIPAFVGNKLTGLAGMVSRGVQYGQYELLRGDNVYNMGSMDEAARIGLTMDMLNQRTSHDFTSGQLDLARRQLITENPERMTGFFNDFGSRARGYSQVLNSLNGIDNRGSVSLPNDLTSVKENLKSILNKIKTGTSLNRRDIGVLKDAESFQYDPEIGALKVSIKAEMQTYTNTLDESGEVDKEKVLKGLNSGEIRSEQLESSYSKGEQETNLNQKIAKRIRETNLDNKNALRLATIANRNTSNVDATLSDIYSNNLSFPDKLKQMRGVLFEADTSDEDIINFLKYKAEADDSTHDGWIAQAFDSTRDVIDDVIGKPKLTTTTEYLESINKNIFDTNVRVMENQEKAAKDLDLVKMSNTLLEMDTKDFISRSSNEIQVAGLYTLKGFLNDHKNMDTLSKSEKSDALELKSELTRSIKKSQLTPDQKKAALADLNSDDIIEGSRRVLDLLLNEGGFSEDDLKFGKQFEDVSEGVYLSGITNILSERGKLTDISDTYKKQLISFDIGVKQRLNAAAGLTEEGVLNGLMEKFLSGNVTKINKGDLEKLLRDLYSSKDSGIATFAQIGGKVLNETFDPSKSDNLLKGFSDAQIAAIKEITSNKDLDVRAQVMGVGNIVLSGGEGGGVTIESDKASDYISQEVMDSFVTSMNQSTEANKMILNMAKQIDLSGLTKGYWDSQKEASEQQGKSISELIKHAEKLQQMIDNLTKEIP